ncbi:MAG: RdgB/HAM1 family non-canonical purine NTP pyrophosphatase [Actinobacteria bacterium]|nr:RdgB/HAM1 family non-canonical purine NTP pyrophosphatase [Actinomycetota bacterium]
MAAPRPAVALATRNSGKVREILEICADWPVRWVTYRDAPWPEVEESGKSYLENAGLKATAVADALGIPAIADDSGIEVDALGGEPGPRSARFAGPAPKEAENLRFLLERLRAVPEESRTARYRCVAVYARPGAQIHSAEATCEGRLLFEPRGSGGFGYDPVFVPRGHHRTMAELRPDDKNAISHRGKALRALRDMLGADFPMFASDPCEEGHESR